jgi:hypothetical protein
MTKFLALLALLALPVIASAQQTIIRDTIIIKGQYSYWGVGYAHTEYSDALEFTLDNLTAGNRSKVAGTADALGFYWPIHQNRALLGVIANGVLESNSGGGHHAAIVQASVSISGMNFLNETIGSGPYIRLDAGPAVITTLSSSAQVLDNAVGIGVLAGLGYMIPLTKETSFAISGNYSARIFSSNYYSTFGFTVGTLF